MPEDNGIDWRLVGVVLLVIGGVLIILFAVYFVFLDYGCPSCSWNHRQGDVIGVGPLSSPATLALLPANETIETVDYIVSIEGYGVGGLHIGAAIAVARGSSPRGTLAGGVLSIVAAAVLTVLEGDFIVGSFFSILGGIIVSLTR